MSICTHTIQVTTWGDRMLLPIVVTALLSGFLAGLLSFKVKSRWCPRCGSLTTGYHPERHP
ncbi:hypothetical protein KRMM14A1259_13580 [Krasilnikovia sp. MM14-A1259]